MHACPCIFLKVGKNPITALNSLNNVSTTVDVNANEVVVLLDLISAEVENFTTEQTRVIESAVLFYYNSKFLDCSRNS